MKTFNNILLGLIGLLVLNSCEQGIDSLTEVDPGPDTTAPSVQISSPSEGAAVKVNEELATITIQFEAQDDIELGSVEVWLNGVRLSTYNNFVDYRKLIVDDLVYDQLADGSHELSVVATDLDGKSTTETVNFTKEPAYISKYDGELLYMPFDGGFVDLLSFEEAAQNGTPLTSEETLAGSGSYLGAEGAYLTLDPERFKNAEFSAIFWLKLNAVPDRAGILAMSPPLNETGGNVLTSGFRLFRENSNGNQKIVLNVGTGDSNTPLNGWEVAEVDPNRDEWVNIAISISQTNSTLFIDGQLVRIDEISGIDWTDVNVLSIMSGAPNFSGWNHLSDQSMMDELRIFDRAISQEEVQQIIMDDSGIVISDYPPTFNGEKFYMPFDGDYKNLFTDTEADIVGDPKFAAEGAAGNDAYAGAEGSYLTYPSTGLTSDTFSATFWYKVNPEPGRAGILVAGPEDTEKEGYPDVQNLRTSGFRFLREGDATRQIFKLNVGTGDAEVWVDGGDAAAFDPTGSGWVHMAITISENTATIYFDGEAVASNTLSAPLDWAGCDLFSIGSGAPRFTEWGHLSDQSFIDELRFFDKALTPEEIQAIRNQDL
ncbi:LamG-like jellyroll fold domain-containing protein [Cytophaga sp. FL35]|uniref:LamG-like jellyroll fold domain-containing protein n=1 Tax=Cytophaga sp. FL35 TaxID=1904456 RepID=UPI001653D746|nr:LamG-like jellyroll fold domain-containing protein [Cytophaga sp. FL35]MBC6997269.1 LamG domain-containing protein [Cytophaga sp. FL35]